ncbi:MAG: Tex family protein [Desulfatirhabdiaceae bacterium]
MNPIHIAKIAQELNLSQHQVQATAELLEADATVPFIARYRKEATDSLDEVAVTAIRDRLTALSELDARRESILKSLEQNGHLTDELNARVLGAETSAELEDIYLPYRPKRRTRAIIAREKGLEPLAMAIWAQTGVDPAAEAIPFVNPEIGVDTAEDALAGARDILAEMVNENADARARIRALFMEKGIIHSAVVAGKETEGAKYRDYFDWKESIATAPSHRVLAMRRGEREDFLNVSIAPPEEEALLILQRQFVTGDGEDSRQVMAAVQDAWKRLLSRSMETEIRLWARENADIEAIRIFSENLKNLLLAPPLGSKRVMGIDPGFRTGCKVVCLDPQGQLLHHDTIYPHTSDHQAEQARKKLVQLCQDYGIEAIAIGNGTAGRETESFVRSIDRLAGLQVIMVNESGASIYSASDVARDEFPDLDLTVRGSVSIGRRLMDPLSELVKIDPKSIGVGQYQHDVDQNLLKQALDDVVISCVNRVGVDVNRASVQLLTYVSGLGPQLAKNILSYRNENGPFKSRDALKKVKRLGPKAFEQAAGFLRILDSDNPLDASAVHPERYAIVNTMAADLGCGIADLMADPGRRKAISIQKYVSDQVGLPTLQDILDELAKPGRDPRDRFETVEFAGGIDKIGDLAPGLKLNGIVTNVTAFGAFVDIGVHQDGLVHISELGDRFVKHPSDVVRVGQAVHVTVMDVDLARNRISLSMKSVPGERPPKEREPAPKIETRKPKAAKPKPPEKNRPFNNPFADIFKR